MASKEQQALADARRAWEDGISLIGHCVIDGTRPSAMDQATLTKLGHSIADWYEDLPAKLRRTGVPTWPEFAYANIPMDEGPKLEWGLRLRRKSGATCADLLAEIEGVAAEQRAWFVGVAAEFAPPSPKEDRDAWMTAQWNDGNAWKNVLAGPNRQWPNDELGSIPAAKSAVERYCRHHGIAMRTGKAGRRPEAAAARTKRHRA